jgi:type III pantothenate kinase
MRSGILTVDLGNSLCKLRLLRPEAEGVRCLARADLAVGPGLAAEATGWVRAAPRPAAALLSSVASRELEAELRKLLSAALGVALEVPAHGLEVRCREPERVGADRLFAARAALELTAEAAIVVDAGTALTVDLVLPSVPGTPLAGVFEGGAIAPGPGLLARILGEGAARLSRIEPRPGVRALGKDTREALEAGVAHGFRGAAYALVEAVAREADLPDLPVVLTGGASAYLREPLFTRLGGGRGRRVRFEEDLVSFGLLAAASGALGAGTLLPGDPPIAPETP